MDVGPHVKVLILDVAERMLRHQIPVLLDFSFWGRKEREDVRSRFREYGVRTWYVEAPSEEVRIKRVIQRNASLHYDRERETVMRRKDFHVEPEHALSTSVLYEPITEDEGEVVHVITL